MIGALVRLLAIGVSLAICAAVAIVVYTVLEGNLSLERLAPASLDAPVSATPERVTFTIRPGQPATAVGEELQEHGLIRSALLFRWEVESRGLGSRLEAGDYEISPSMSTREIVAVLARGAVVHATTFTSLEGWRAEQVAQRIEELQLAKAEEFLRLVRSPRENGITPPDPSARTLEGYLFPDTYEFDRDVSARQIVDRLLRQFDRRLGPDLRSQAAARGMSVHQLVTLASIIEREAAVPAERPLVAAVYQNRLAAGMKLDADPTVQYAVATLDLHQAIGYGFWKRELTIDDLAVDSPYNTYRVSGVPPGPICSPGFDALQAAVQPAQVGYLFFVARGDGSHAFADTLAEHNANVSRFR